MVTNKIFGMFMCYTVDDNTSFLQQDFSISCETWKYFFHKWVCVLLIFVIPLGIPSYFGWMLYKAKGDIMEDKGPHHMENLYKEYKPECCLWEIYQMFQKVTLIGLLTFAYRGSILQCVLGLMVSNSVFIIMVKVQPYADAKTNLLAITGEGVVALTFFSALLLRVDLTGEALTVDLIGGILLCSNIPMGLLLAWDTSITMQDELAAAQIDMLRAELGEDNARYRCIKACKVMQTRRLKAISRRARQKEKVATTVRDVQVGDVIEALEHTFTRKGDAKIRIADGWVNYSLGGLTGDRNFALMIKPGQAPKSGKIRLRVEREGSSCTVTILKGKRMKDMHLLGINDVFVVVSVNGVAQRTSTAVNCGSAPVWGENGMGDALTFELGETKVEEITVSCYDEDRDAHAQMQEDREKVLGAEAGGGGGGPASDLAQLRADVEMAVKEQQWDRVAVLGKHIQVLEAGGADAKDQLIGECKLQLFNLVHPGCEERGTPWEFEGWRVVREVTGQMASQTKPDANHDGVLTTDELNALDQDGDGVVTTDEFKTVASATHMAKEDQNETKKKRSWRPFSKKSANKPERVMETEFADDAAATAVVDHEEFSNPLQLGTDKDDAHHGEFENPLQGNDQQPSRSPSPTAIWDDDAQYDAVEREEDDREHDDV